MTQFEKYYEKAEVILRWHQTNPTKSLKMMYLIMLQKILFNFIYLDVQVDPVGRVGQVVLNLHWH